VDEGNRRQPGRCLEVHGSQSYHSDYTALQGEWDTAKDESKAAVRKFEAVKQKRREKFMRAFNHIQKKIDEVYKVRRLFFGSYKSLMCFSSLYCVRI
jgi:hypothetical protein